MKNVLLVLGLVVVIVALILAFGPSRQESVRVETSPPAPEPAPEPSPSPLPPPQPTEGRVVFAVTDAAAGLENIDGIIVTTKEVRVQSAAKGWVTVSEETKSFDLLKLKESGSFALLTEANLEAGEYNQVRLSVSKVEVIEKSSGKISLAKLPSGDLKLVGKLVVEAGNESSVVLDFLADKSLHTTGQGSYIFAPVITLETKSNAEISIGGGLVSIGGGKTDTNITIGMNESGEVGINVAIDAGANLEIVGDAIRVMAKGESEAAVSITAKGAIDAAVGGEYLDSAISVKMITREGKKTWLVTGLKGLEITNIYVDASTGVVVRVE